MNTDLFVHFAEIAGVFVGFGALIGLRSEQVRDVHDVVYLTAVLLLALWVVIAALVPIVISSYGVRAHQLWFSSALVALVLWAVLLVVVLRHPGFRALNRSEEALDRFFPVVGLPLHLTMAASLGAVIAGAWRTVDDALYVTALAAGVVFAGYTLLASVIGRKPEVGQGGSE